MESNSSGSNDGSWRSRAECLKVNPEMFFPVPSESTHIGRREREEAKKVCQRCSVREQCLAYALKNNEDHGVWGGMTEGERRRLKQKGAARSVGAAALNRMSR